MAFTRRTLISTTAATAASSLVTGCIGTDPSDGGSGRTKTRSSFFVFGDVTAQVAGGSADTEVLVPVGQHGHGWEPGPRLREDVHDADLLVHGPRGFQPWVDDIRHDVSGDDVETVEVNEDLEMLDWERGHEQHDGGDEEHGHGKGDVEEEHHHDDENEGEESGDYTATGAGVNGDVHHESGDEEGGPSTTHVDPHFWMDPLRVKESTYTVADALASIDPESEDVYEENAERFRSDLDDLHYDIEEVVEEAAKDVVLLAGHGSMRYLAERYDVQVVSMTETSPDDQATFGDHERAQEVVEEHDLGYVCADPLESQQAANQLVSETDAEEALPLTAMPGQTEEWRRQDMGYVDIMRQVNLPTLKQALESR